MPGQRQHPIFVRVNDEPVVGVPNPLGYTPPPWMIGASAYAGVESVTQVSFTNGFDGHGITTPWFEPDIGNQFSFTDLSNNELLVANNMLLGVTFTADWEDSSSNRTIFIEKWQNIAYEGVIFGDTTESSVGGHQTTGGAIPFRANESMKFGATQDGGGTVAATFRVVVYRIAPFSPPISSCA